MAPLGAILCLLLNKKLKMLNSKAIKNNYLNWEKIFAFCNHYLTIFYYAIAFNKNAEISPATFNVFS